MSRTINQVAVLGLGKVGELVATLLVESGFKVVGLDAARRELPGLEAHQVDAADRDAVRDALRGVDAVVSCLPFHANIPVAEVAHELGVHYFDLTEDVPTTDRIIQLAAQDARALMAPQCGLAPGLVGIVAASLAQEFDSLRSMELKVGALPQNPTGLLGYAFTWSAEGVVNEYLNDCEVVRGGRRQLVPAMSDDERVVLGGLELEASLTSGGLGTMCRTYEGRVERLDYKTMRYPGHFAQMRFLFDELGLRADRELAGRILQDAKPPVDDDVVHVHVAVEGVRDGRPARANHVRSYLPIEVAGRTWRAISWTTAASCVAVVELVADGVLPASGFLKQEDVALTDLLATRAGSLLAQPTSTGRPA